MIAGYVCVCVCLAGNRESQVMGIMTTSKKKKKKEGSSDLNAKSMSLTPGSKSVISQMQIEGHKISIKHKT